MAKTLCHASINGLQTMFFWASGTQILIRIIRSGSRKTWFSSHFFLPAKGFKLCKFMSGSHG